MSDFDKLQKRTIEDFGEQWTTFTENSGYYASTELFIDILGTLLDTGEIAGKRVLDIGSGSGRIVNMLLDCQAAHVTALEPSDAYKILKKNVSRRSEQVHLVNAPGHQIPSGKYDLAFSLGVIHHIPKPDEVMKAVYEALPAGGKFFIWVYGKEGNGAYLLIYKTLVLMTARLSKSHIILLSKFLNLILSLYIGLCNWIPGLPLRKYVQGVLKPLAWKDRTLVIFDQLNPAYAKYYLETEVVDLFRQNGFKNIRTFHRHGYSWSAIGEK